LLISQRALGWGVSGAALATAISQYFGVFVLWQRLRSRCARIKCEPNLKPKSYILGLPRPKLSDCRRILGAGTVLVLRTASGWGAMSLSSLVASSLGASLGASHPVCFQVWLSASLLSDAIAISAQALLATTMAKKDSKSTQKIISLTLLMGAGLGIAIGGFLGIMGSPIIRLFSNDPVVIASAESIWPIVAASQPLNALAFAIDGILFGARDFTACAVLMVLAAVPASALMLSARKTGFISAPIFGLRRIWIGLALLMLFRSVFGALRISSGKGPWVLLKYPVVVPVKNQDQKTTQIS